MKVTFPVIIETIKGMKDRSVKITISTREFSPDESSVLFSLRGAEAWALFASAPVEDDIELPDEAVYSHQGKSPSQRLRNVLYKLWEQKGVKGEFQQFYDDRINNLIDKIKDKLND